MDRELMQWRLLIYDDLTAAKRKLRSRPGATAGAFLRARIAEDEAILDRVEQIERDVGASAGADAPAMASTR